MPDIMGGADEAAIKKTMFKVPSHLWRLQTYSSQKNICLGVH